MHRLVLCLVILSAALTGCGTSPDSLRKPARAEQIHLSDGLSVVTYRGSNVRCEEGVLPGTYTAEMEDDEGTYFFGAGRAIWNTNAMIQKTPRVRVGGIYLPRDTNRPPHFFWVLESEVHTVENLGQGIQDRIVLGVSTPSTTGGIGARPVIAGNLIAGVLVAGLLQAENGRLWKLEPLQDEAVKRKILEGRRTLP